MKCKHRYPYIFKGLLASLATGGLCARICVKCQKGWPDIKGNDIEINLKSIGYKDGYITGMAKATPSSEWTGVYGSSE